MVVDEVIHEKQQTTYVPNNGFRLPREKECKTNGIVRYVGSPRVQFLLRRSIVQSEAHGHPRMTIRTPQLSHFQVKSKEQTRQPQSREGV